jgi:hypothetical protein
MKDWPDPRFPEKPVSRLEIIIAAGLTLGPIIAALYAILHTQLSQ